MSDYIVFRCKWYDEGVCLLYSTDKETEYCMDGPCSNEACDKDEEAHRS